MPNLDRRLKVMLRQVLQQPIAINVTASFAQNTLVISDA